MERYYPLFVYSSQQLPLATPLQTYRITSSPQQSMLYLYQSGSDEGSAASALEVGWLYSRRLARPVIAEERKVERATVASIRTRDECIESLRDQEGDGHAQGTAIAGGISARHRRNKRLLATDRSGDTLEDGVVQVKWQGSQMPQAYGVQRAPRVSLRTRTVLRAPTEYAFGRSRY